MKPLAYLIHKFFPAMCDNPYEQKKNFVTEVEELIQEQQRLCIRAGLAFQEANAAAEVATNKLAMLQRVLKAAKENEGIMPAYNPSGTPDGLEAEIDAAAAAGRVTFDPKKMN